MLRGSRLVIRLFLGSDHGIALIRFVHVGGTSGPLCAKDESDRSLEQEGGHRGGEQAEGSGLSRIGAEPGRGDSAPGSRRPRVMKVAPFWQHLSIIGGFRAISSGVSFLTGAHVSPVPGG